MPAFTLRKKLTVAVAVLASAAIGSAAWAQSKTLRIGTSSTGSVFYALAVGLTKMLDGHAKITATAEPVGGSTANIFAIAAD